MEVKKLEWVFKGYNIAPYWRDFGDLFEITEITKNKFKARSNISEYDRKLGIFDSKPDLGNFETLEQAKQACQDHYKSFVLSQIENDHIIVEHDMAFNPRLLGYTEVKQTKLGQTRYDNPKTLSFIVFDPVHNHWNIFFKNLTSIEWVYIPNHNFGVKLISMFLGEKIDAN